MLILPSLWDGTKSAAAPAGGGSYKKKQEFGVAFGLNLLNSRSLELFAPDKPGEEFLCILWAGLDLG